MGKLIYIFILLLFATNSFGQLEFDNSVFPNQGDSIFYIKDQINNSISLTPGENKTWNLKKLDSPLYDKLKFVKSDFVKDISQEGKVFFNQDERFSYFLIKTEKGIEEIGFVFNNNDSPGPKVVFYDNPIVITPLSLKFNNKIEGIANFRFELNKSELPEEMRADLPSTVNRIRVEGEKKVTRISDAYGRLILPKGIFRVNRIKVSENIEFRLYDTKSGKAIPYFDEEMIRKIYPKPFVNKRIEFYSKEHTHFLAKLELDDEGRVKSVDYQSTPPEHSGINLKSKYSDFVLFPNPTYNLAKVYISGHDDGDYYIAIYNIIGKKLWQRRVKVSGQSIIKENFGFLPKGSYMISLLDNNGNIIRTTRLIIISV